MIEPPKVGELVWVWDCSEFRQYHVYEVVRGTIIKVGIGGTVYGTFDVSEVERTEKAAAINRENDLREQANNLATRISAGEFSDA